MYQRTVPTQRFKNCNGIGAAAFFCAIAFMSASADAQSTTLLLDTFNVDANSQDMNFELSTRQSGTLAPITYTDGGVSTFAQVGNSGAPNALLMAGRAGGTGGSTSLDYNFNQNVGQGNAFVIQFDVDPVLTGDSSYNTTPTAWITVDFGTSSATRNGRPQEVDGMGILFRGNGGTQVFSNGVDLFQGNFTANPGGYHHILLEAIDDSGNGNPFNDSGSPTTILAYADGSSTPFFDYVQTNGFSNNYISIRGEGEGSGGDGVVRHALDNLSLSTQPVPEPSTFALLGVGVVSLAAYAWRRKRRRAKA